MNERYQQERSDVLRAQKPVRIILLKFKTFDRLLVFELQIN